MKTKINTFILAALLGVISLSASAQTMQCIETSGFKFVALPQLYGGLDIWNNALGVYTPNTVLADDFPCTNSGPITDIHLWGGWYNDEKGTITNFWLGIYDDVPAVTNVMNGQVTPSHPGTNLLWQQSFGPGQFAEETDGTGNGQFYDAADQIYFATGDTQAWYYCFYPSNPFVQQGTPAHPTNYWLAVYAQNATQTNSYGWRTAATNYHDAAVWGTVGSATGLPLGDWHALTNTQTFQPINLSFKLTTLTNPPPPDCIYIACPTNPFVLYACGNNCMSDPALFGSIFVANTCNPTNLLVNYSVGGMLIDSNYCFTPGYTTVTLTASDPSTGQSNQCAFLVDTLTNCPPPNLVWRGTVSSNWDLTSLNWSNADASLDGVSYEQGDAVVFDDTAIDYGTNVVNLEGVLTPASVTVDTTNTYDFGGSGSLSGVMGLNIIGTGRLIVEMPIYPYSGVTTISPGSTLQIMGGPWTGMGAVINDGSLVFDHSGTLVVSNVISGTGTLTQNSPAGGDVILDAANTYSGNTVIKGGTLTLANDQALGNSPNVFVSFPAGYVDLSSGVNIPASHSLYLSATESTNISSSLVSVSVGEVLQDTDIWDGPITLVGDGNTNDQLAFGAESNSTLIVTGPWNTPSVASNIFLGTLHISGGGTIILHGKVTLPQTNTTLEVDEGSLCVIANTSNSWGTTYLENGTIQLEADNALPTTSKVQSSMVPQAGSGYLDLHGFNQQIAGLLGGNIRNDSTTTNSTLFYVGEVNQDSTFPGTIADNGTNTVGLTVESGHLTMTSPGNAYHGDTKVSGGELELDIPQPTLAANSTVTVASNAVLQLDLGVTNQVSRLVLNGVSQPSGLYSTANSAPYLAGMGYLWVQSAPASTNLLHFSVSGNTLSLSWPADQGWRLEEATNLTSPTWVYLTDGTINSTNITINDTNYPPVPLVFLRLVYP